MFWTLASYCFLSSPPVVSSFFPSKSVRRFVGSSLSSIRGSARSNPWFCFSLHNGRNRDLVLLHRLAPYLLLRSVCVCVYLLTALFSSASLAYQEFGFNAQQWAICMQRMPSCSSMPTKLTNIGGDFHSLTLSTREEPWFVLS